MENASKALELAFFVIIFCLALALAIGMFSMARETSEIVLKRADQTEYYDYIEYGDQDSAGNRIVGFETIIPTLYKYNKERYKVVFKKGTLNEDGSVSNLQFLPVYETTTEPSGWSSSYKNECVGKSICSFDIEEESLRGEPWLGSSTEVKKNLDAIFSAGKYILPQYGNQNRFINYQNNNLLKWQKNNKKFVEMVGTKITTVNGITGNKTTTKKVITYVLIN